MGIRFFGMAIDNFFNCEPGIFNVKFEFCFVLVLRIARL